MARTHTELYRRFQGVRAARGPRPWPLVAAGVHAAVKPKLPLALLYLPVGITTVVYGFIVHGKYAGEDMAETIGLLPAITKVAQRALLGIEVAEKVAEASHVMQLFALLAVSWYGAGAIAEDRRHGAHLLYFARPLTRFDYVAAKLLTVGFFGALASLVPGLVICLVAAWSSPDWSFLRDEGDVVWRTAAYALLWIAVTSAVVLCASSLARRKTLALAAAFGFFVLNHVLGGVLGFVDQRWQAVSLIFDLRKVRNWLLEVDDWRNLAFGLDVAFLALGGTVAVALGVLWLRVSRMEAVA